MKLLLSAFFVVCFHTVATASTEPPELIVVNAKVRTMVSAGDTAEAIAVSADKITAVGSNKQILALAGPGTRRIDAKGRLALPGFNDAHTHFIALGNTFSSLDLRDVRTPEDIVSRIGEHTKFIPEGRWILGSGLALEQRQGLTKAAIDAAAPKHPVFIYFSDSAYALVNDLALKNANLGKDSKIEGLERDSRGDLTGTVRNPALDRIRAAVPASHAKDTAALAISASRYAASLGITSVQDTHADDHTPIYLELERRGFLHTRVYECKALHERLLWQPTASTEASRLVRNGCLKGFYESDDPDWIPGLTKDVIQADKAGRQVLVHAIGPVSNATVLDILESAIKTNGSRDRRFRIEHAHYLNKADIKRVAAGQIVASMQPYLFESGSGPRSGNYRSLLDGGVRLAFGSDAPMTRLDPLLGIAAAVNGSTESITVYEAVRAYTLGSAYAEFQEAVKGTIQAGKLADLIILSDDIFQTDRAAIGRARVLMTIVGGDVVYDSN